MASHHDDDAGNPEMNAAIRRMFSDKADQLTEARANLITAGEPGEKPLYKTNVGGIDVTCMPDDPLAVRVSIGRPHDLDEGAYCVFRGKPSEVENLLEQALVAVRRAHEPEVR